MSHTPVSPGLQIFKIVLYVLAGLILALSLVTGFSLVTSANSLAANMLLPLQLLGGGAVSNLFASMFSGFFINLGILVMILGAILSALLYAVGRLIAYIASLETRLARLEAGR